jgi:carboxyl-terminal processing protease
MDDFFKHVEKEEPELKFNEEQYKISEELLKLRMKAVLAQDIWGYSEFYQVINNTNEILEKAISVINSDQYDTLLEKK